MWKGALFDDGLFRWLDRRKAGSQTRAQSWRAGWAESVSETFLHRLSDGDFTVFAALQTRESQRLTREIWAQAEEGLCEIGLSPTPTDSASRLVVVYEAGPIRRKSQLALKGSSRAEALAQEGYTKGDELGFTSTPEFEAKSPKPCTEFAKQGLRSFRREIEMVHPPMSAQIRLVGLHFGEPDLVPQRVLHFRLDARGRKLDPTSLAVAVSKEGRRIVGFISRSGTAGHATVHLVSVESGAELARFDIAASGGPLELVLMQSKVIILDSASGLAQIWRHETPGSASDSLRDLGSQLTPARLNCVAREVAHDHPFPENDSAMTRPAGCEHESVFFAWSRDPRTGSRSLRGVFRKESSELPARLLGDWLPPGLRPPPLCESCVSVFLRHDERSDLAVDRRLILVEHGESTDLDHLLVFQRRDFETLPRPKAGQSRIEFQRLRPGNLIDVEIGAELKRRGWREIYWRYHGSGPARARGRRPERPVSASEAMALIESGAKPYLLLDNQLRSRPHALPFSWIDRDPPTALESIPWPRSRAAPILLHGRSSLEERPLVAEQWLKERGYQNVHVLEGGGLEWRHAMGVDQDIQRRSGALGFPKSP
jgi:hypothetical protein